ncbi:MAG: condensation domain-containing protein [Acinetobacter sp.]
MSNHQAIMSDDLFGLFESELHNIGLSETASNTEIPKNTTPSNNNLALSLSEERAWMLHQQDPLAASGPFLVGLKLTGDVKIDHLMRSIQTLYADDSNLNLRYQLDQAGQLVKCHQPLQQHDIHIHLVDSDEQAIQHLLTLMQIPMDLSRDPAIQFVLMPKNNQEVILGILGHHILLDDRAWKPIFNHFSHFYNTAEVLAVPSMQASHFSHDETVALAYWKQQYPFGMNKVQWPALFQRSPYAVPIQKYGQASTLVNEPKVTRVFTTIDASHVDQLSQTAQSSILHSMVLLFGRYVQGLLDLDTVDVFVPVVEHNEIASLNQIQSSSNILPIRISRPTQDISEQIVQIRNQILQGMQHNVSIEQILSATKTQRSLIPNILVTQFMESTQYLSLQQIDVQSLAIPPLHAGHDLTLAFQLKDQQQLQLELTTGEQLSASIAAVLLEQFVAFLHQDHSQNISLPIFSLPLPSNASQAPTASAVDSQTPIENAENLALAALILDEFKAVLLNPELSIYDNFFDQGGHSILATRVLGKLQSQHQIQIKIADFFNAPTAIALSQYAEYQQQNQSSQRVFHPDQEIVAPITLLQKAFMGFSDQGRDAIFNIPFAFRFTEMVDESAFYAAFVDILQRHHALRSIFVFHSPDDISQTVVPLNQISQHPWFWASDTQGTASAQQILKQEANHQFELQHEFPIRVRFLKDEQGRHILSLLLYHIAMDEWSSGILIQELLAAYTARVGGQAPVWEKTPRQFHEYALEQDESSLQAHLDYWLNAIGKIKKQPALLHSQVQTVVEHEEDVAGASVEFSLNATETEHLYQLAKDYKSSIFYVVYAAIVLSVHFLGGGKKILTGTSVACRDQPEYQETIGYFTNVVMHYTQFAEDLRIGDLVQQVQNNIFNTLPYADIPFAVVEELVRHEDEESTESPYEVYIQLHAKNALTGTFALPDGHEIGFELLEPERDSAKFGLHFEVYEEPLSEENRLRVVINYRVHRYSKEQIQLIQHVTQHVLHGFMAGDDSQQADVMQLRKHLAHINLH